MRSVCPRGAVDAGESCGRAAGEGEVWPRDLRLAGWDARCQKPVSSRGLSSRVAGADQSQNDLPLIYTAALHGGTSLRYLRVVAVGASLRFAMGKECVFYPGGSASPSGLKLLPTTLASEAGMVTWSGSFGKVGLVSCTVREKSLSADCLDRKQDRRIVQ